MSTLPQYVYMVVDDNGRVHKPGRHKGVYLALSNAKAQATYDSGWPRDVPRRLRVVEFTLTNAHVVFDTREEQPNA